jgi:hypothetical protein
MLPIALAAWTGALRAARSMPVLFCVCGVLLFAVALVTLRIVILGDFGWPFCVAAVALGLAMVWVEAVLVRLVLRHLMVGDDGGLAALRPGWSQRRVAGVVVLTQLMAAGSPALLAALLSYLDREIGDVSTWLSVPLLLPLMCLGMAFALRLSLAAAPASLGLSAPLADSWGITETHMLFMAGAWIMGIGPLLIVLAAVAPVLKVAALGGVPAALGLTLWWIALAGAQAGLMVGFYQRWQTALRPDMRPSRNRARRLEPAVGG